MRWMGFEGKELRAGGKTGPWADRRAKTKNEKTIKKDDFILTKMTRHQPILIFCTRARAALSTGGYELNCFVTMARIRRQKNSGRFKLANLWFSGGFFYHKLHRIVRRVPSRKRPRTGSSSSWARWCGWAPWRRPSSPGPRGRWCTRGSCRSACWHSRLTPVLKGKSQNLYF